jgi:hypothetical protein
MIISLIVVSLACASSAQQSAPAFDAEKFQQNVQLAAKKLTWLDPNDILYDRRDGVRHKYPRAVENYRLLDALLADPAPLEQVLPLLGDEKPNVRTLGIALLYRNGSVKDMSALLPLLNDATETIPAPPPLSAAPITFTDKNWHPQPQHVGDLAQEVLKMYIRAAYPWSGEYLPPTAEHWRKFWEPRAHLARHTVDMVVALERATRGTTPPPPERAVQITRVVDQARDLAPPDSFYVCLTLDQLWNGHKIIDPPTLLQLARQVPRNQRAACLRGEKFTDDPDIDVTMVQQYLVEHADELLLPEDGQWLFDEAIARAKKGEANPNWFVAAATLHPLRAGEILKLAMDASHNWAPADRAKIIMGMFDMLGEPAFPTILDWLFRTSPDPDQIREVRTMFLEHARESRPALFRQLAAKIVADKRLDLLGPRSLRVLIESASGWLGEPLASEVEMSRSINRDEAQVRDQTEWLPQWREKLRASLSKWNPATQPTR